VETRISVLPAWKMEHLSDGLDVVIRLCKTLVVTEGGAAIRLLAKSGSWHPTWPP
jgi:hypothetical protein